MSRFYYVLLLIHASCGCIALLAGIIALLSQKGDKTHRSSGKFFYYSLTISLLIGITISVLKENDFLLYIGLFSMYMLFSGWRSIRNKSLRFTLSFIDYLATLIALIVSGFMFYSGNLILIVFGFINTFFALGDLHILHQNLKQKIIFSQQYLIRHIGRMMGAFIASVTAFLVVQLQHVSVNPYWLPWLLPTFLGVPIIVFFIRKTVHSNPHSRQIN